MRQLSLLLTGGTVIDGTGREPFQADIGIKDDRVAFIGDAAASSVQAEHTVDVRGLVVTPGFIDTHCHSEFTLLSDPRATGKLLQGITTEVNGNCGLSAAPLVGDAMARREPDLREYDIRERWETFAEYFSIMEGRLPALNVMTLAGQGNIRASVVGYADRAPSGAEMAGMKSLLRAALSEGATGMSTGLIYPPGVYTSTGEIIELARYGRETLGQGFIYTSHMRSEGDRLLESIEETLLIGKEAGVRVHVSHLKTSGRENWHKAGECISMLDGARAAGVHVSCDRYPYTAGATDLDAVLPPWAFEGGNDAELLRLRTPEVRGKLLKEMSRERARWDDVVVSSVETEANRWMEGMSLLAIADRLGKAPEVAVLDVLLEETLRVGAIFHGMSEENLMRFLSLPYAMVGSDSSARSLEGPTRKGKPHPRGFGSFPRYLRMFQSDLSDAVHRITGLPAGTFGIADRGTLKEGYFADLVIFDAGKVEDTATYAQPFSAPKGIYHVLVNGTFAVRDGDIMTERPGRVLRGGRTEV